MFILSPKHRILKELKEIYDERTYGAGNYTDIGKSLSLNQLNIKTGLRINVLDNNIKALISEDLVASANIKGQDDITFYYLTYRGHNAFSDHRFLWFLVDKALAITTLIIAILGFLNSIFGWWEHK